ncbi:uncharacterized protein PV07_12876 [Cladophialophora immunda]|uniref:Uncharacterized protein n=1 Tax=Cladophialophora immunda TaxID=569365 RepID=A0A0D1Z1Z8_9EURO|nr:uncharacterized protein PV07_12876 [Cladophialophora immunda]KIW21691.1 hypothetical protein PV07_12876 [Cladophialophora immunda]
MLGLRVTTPDSTVLHTLIVVISHGDDEKSRRSRCFADVVDGFADGRSRLAVSEFGGPREPPPSKLIVVGQRVGEIGNLQKVEPSSKGWGAALPFRDPTE